MIDLTKVSLIPYVQVSHDTVAYDHPEIIKYAYQRLKWKMEYTNVARNILPNEFTLRELQSVYEMIFQKPFDKRNFRKKILSMNLINETGNYDSVSSKRPAMLYQFRDKELLITENIF